MADGGPAFIRAAIASLFLLLNSVEAPAQGSRGTIRPSRIFTISGQVSLPNGQPAGGVLVKIVSRAGTPREVFTTDSGRFEFTAMDEGEYVLTAKSLADATLVSDPVSTETGRTATGNINVSIVLREHPNSENLKPSVVNAGEIAQKIPKDAQKAFGQGLKFKDNKDMINALESFSRAIELYPQFIQAFAERGDVYVYQRKLKDASADFERAIVINPHYAPALRGAGYCKLEEKDFEAAIRYFEDSLSADPTDARTHLLLGIANLQLDRRDAARASLLKALSFNPPPLRAHVHLANLYAKEHHYKEAVEELRKYLDAEPTIPDRAELESVEAKWRALAESP